MVSGVTAITSRRHHHHDIGQTELQLKTFLLLSVLAGLIRCSLIFIQRQADNCWQDGECHITFNFSQILHTLLNLPANLARAQSVSLYVPNDTNPQRHSRKFWFYQLMLFCSKKSYHLSTYQQCSNINDRIQGVNQRKRSWIKIPIFFSPIHI